MNATNLLHTAIQNYYLGELPSTAPDTKFSEIIDSVEDLNEIAVEIENLIIDEKGDCIDLLNSFTEQMSLSEAIAILATKLNIPGN